MLKQLSIFTIYTISFTTLCMEQNKIQLDPKMYQSLRQMAIDNLAKKNISKNTEPQNNPTQSDGEVIFHKTDREIITAPQPMLAEFRYCKIIQRQPQSYLPETFTYEDKLHTMRSLHDMMTKRK